MGATDSSKKPKPRKSTKQADPAGGLDGVLKRANVTESERSTERLVSAQRASAARRNAGLGMGPTPAQNRGISVNDYNSLQASYNDQTRSMLELQSQRKKDENTIRGLESERDSLEKTVQDLQETVAMLQKTLSNTTDQLKVATTHSSHMEAGRSSQITKTVEEFTKVVLFRNYKFFHPHKPEELQKAMKLCWKYIEKKPCIQDDGLDAAKFVFMYQPVVTHAVSEMRTYAQSQGKKAAKEWWKVHDDLPSVEDIEGIWDFNPNSQDRDGDKAKLLLWWVDTYLAMFVGPGTWSLNHRKFQMLTQPTTIKFLETEKCCVTVSTEAFARLVYHNCREKWLNTFILKKRDENATIPKTKDADDAEKYMGKWSDRRNEQVKGGGWAPEARTVFIQYIHDIWETRKTDQKEAWAKHEFARRLIRSKYKVPAETTTPPAKRQKKRKQREEESGHAKPPEVEDMVEVDD